MSRQLIPLAFVAMLLALPARAVAAPTVSWENAMFKATMSNIDASVAVVTTERPRYVELMTRNRFGDTWSVSDMVVRGSGGRYEATFHGEGHRVPNTPLGWKMRATFANGDTATSEERQMTVVDDRFSWHVLEGKLVRLHWYEGGDDFGRRALAIGEKAVGDVSKLLGVTETKPIDYFVYSDAVAWRQAMGPGTPENAAGQANTSIRTLFAVIGPTQVNSDWVPTVITHELSHLVFNTAIENPYHGPPRWLDEGLAVYLSEGYGTDDKLRLSAANARGALIPLDGLRTAFPSSSGERFILAYSEGVSAVDFFVRKYGQPTLVKLIRSYANGVTDDESFRAATGADMAAFNDAWLKDLRADVPQVYGPRPAPTGLVPPGWTAGSAQPTSPGGARSPSVPAATAPPASLGDEGDSEATLATIGLVVLLLALGAAIVIGVLASRRTGLPPRPPA